jgi:hypothetical protein
MGSSCPPSFPCSVRSVLGSITCSTAPGDRGASPPVRRQNFRPGKTIDVVSRRATRDSARHPDLRCDPIRVGDASRSPARDARPARRISLRARPNRRFQPSDRLLWLILRRVWPRWRDALVLVQPATVATPSCITRWSFNAQQFSGRSLLSSSPGTPDTAFPDTRAPPRAATRTSCSSRR